MTAAPESIPAPLDVHRETVRPDWIDYNGHMNVGYYDVVFDHGTDALLDFIGVGEAYRRQEGCSIFVVEQHLLYKAELSLGDPVRITTQLLGFDEKRMHYFHRMFHAANGYLAATSELLTLHVDLQTRRARPLSGVILDRLGAIAAAHAGLPRPPELGRAIGLASGKPG